MTVICANERLAQGYLAVLRANSLEEAFTAPELSGLFLSSLPNDFTDAAYRVMVVGMEPKKWRNAECLFKKEGTPTLAAVLDSINGHRKFLDQSAGPHRFLQFFKSANSQVQASLSGKSVAFVWANLFCMSHAAGSPVRSTYLAQIQTVSASLLRAQIEVVNPRRKISDAVEATLRASGAFEGLQPDAEEELVEKAAANLFIETREFSERVTGKIVFIKSTAERNGSGTTWLPEDFPKALAQKLDDLGAEELREFRAEVEDADLTGREIVLLGDLPVPVSKELVGILKSREAKLAAQEKASPSDLGDMHPKAGPIVLDVIDNFDNLQWQLRYKPRIACVDLALPKTIVTPLKSHQLDSFAWQQAAWLAGLPGVLNADEQGLGKTLQTIAFLVWLKLHMADPRAKDRGPVLVVAPTSLLQNWEQEVATHVERPGLGNLIRLYGSGVGARKQAGVRGRDTDDGSDKLDFDLLHEAIKEGRAHRTWVLTTYTTLTNYQHSLGRIPFSVVVFDEIQALKNPFCLRAVAASAINADFRIGLTGTPIENSATDLWAIMEQLASGSLGHLKDFRRIYAAPDKENMAELHRQVFRAQEGRPPFALRRMKEMVARDLPIKSRFLHPRLMPALQAQVYERARMKLAEGGPAAALKALHHIRSVSVHPAPEVAGSNDDFVSASARIVSVFDVLKKIQAAGERVLVFIEHLQMQYRFIELVRAEFGLASIDLINGSTPIPKRQAIVNKFQRHLDDDRGFDILVLGPKAAGTGLTLTAATHVIHLSRWWNPAVEEQCNDRVHRLGQTRPVTIHVPMAVHPLYREHSFDCLLHSLMSRKRTLAASALWPMGDTQADAAALQDTVAAEAGQATNDPLDAAMTAMFERDKISRPTKRADGAVAFS